MHAIRLSAVVLLIPSLSAGILRTSSAQVPSTEILDSVRALREKGRSDAALDYLENELEQRRLQIESLIAEYAAQQRVVLATSSAITHFEAGYQVGSITNPRGYPVFDSLVARIPHLLTNSEARDLNARVRQLDRLFDRTNVPRQTGVLSWLSRLTPELPIIVQAVRGALATALGRSGNSVRERYVATYLRGQRYTREQWSRYAEGVQNEALAFFEFLEKEQARTAALITELQGVRNNASGLSKEISDRLAELDRFYDCSDCNTIPSVSRTQARKEKLNARFRGILESARRSQTLGTEHARFIADAEAILRRGDLQSRVQAVKSGMEGFYESAIQRTQEEPEGADSRTLAIWRTRASNARNVLATARNDYEADAR